ncbi:low molecular weight phosphatase family protein [Microbacterium awajiense]|uniref:Low molecular weight phosphatase family protein n=1 Tax=Microbacterium awajiense TaxID=415214 RepID=A0ABP7AL62_9MICO
MNVNDRFRIVTVCTGNIHRSALAAALLRRWADWYLPDAVARHVEVGSVGTSAPVGEPAGVEITAIAASLGADVSDHLARKLDDHAVLGTDLVLTATRRHREAVIAAAPSTLRTTFTIREIGRVAEHVDAPSITGIEDLRRRVATLSDAREVAEPRPDLDDVVDPDGREPEVYVQMVQQQVAPLVHLAHALFGMPRPDVRAYLEAVASTGELTERVRAAGANR